MTVLSYFKRLARDENGATAIEYGLLAAILGIGVIASLDALIGGNGVVWTYLTDKVQNPN